MADIDKFTLVQIQAASAGKPTVQPWLPSPYEEPALETPPRVLGVTMTDSDYGDPVAVMKRGYLRDVAEQNSETWAVEDILWAKSDGTITKTRPTAPLPLVRIGSVFSGTHGVANYIIDVDVQVIPSIMELTSVLVDAPVDKDVLIYNGTSHYYETRQLDHGADIAGLTPDDDHTQYQLEWDFRESFLFMGGN